MSPSIKAEVLSSKLSSLEQELRVLQAQLSKSSKKTKKSFSSLKGIWKGKGKFSDEEIKSAQIKFEIIS